jgi:glycosyltransferase involved in cell wall biosynthesis
VKARRVAFVTTSYPRAAGDASGHFVQTEARRRAQAGDDVHVLAPGPGPGAFAAPGEDGVRVHWLPGGDAFGWPGVLVRLSERPTRIAAAARFVIAARSALRRLGPFDAVVAHWILPSAWPIAASAGAATSLEIVAHGSDVRLVERLPGVVRRALAAELLGRGARFRFVSSELQDRFARATTPAVLRHSHVQASPVDVPATLCRREARTRLGLGEERIAVVVGRLIATKHPEHAVRLAAARADRVVVIGDGPLEQRVRRTHPGATLLGKLPRGDALTWIAAADLLVSASTEEGAPTVVREARALGTAVLAVTAGDLAELASLDPGIALVPRDEAAVTRGSGA